MFQPIIPREATVDWLAEHDLELALDILTHNETGRELCQWKTITGR